MNIEAMKRTQATQAEVTDEQIKEAAVRAAKDGKLSWLGFDKDDQDRYTIPVLSKSHYQFARAILALRPERKGEPVEGAQEIHDRLMRIVEGVEMYGAPPGSRQRASQLQEIARSILALRPERVPMTEDAVERAAMYWAPEYRAALKAGIASAEAHHCIIAQTKKETT